MATSQSPYGSLVSLPGREENEKKLAHDVVQL
jgi:hypothetical protein